MIETGQPDSDKLPWLEPYREPAAPRPRLREVTAAPLPARRPPNPRRRLVGTSLGASLGLLAAAGLAVGGYWVGRRSASDAGDARSAIVTPLPPVGSERPVLTYPAIEDSVGVTTGAAADEDVIDAAPAAAVATPAPARPGPTATRPRTAVRAAPTGKPPPPPVAAPPPPKPRSSAMPSPVTVAPPPGPRAAPVPLPGKPGRNLLLGYYVTPRHTEQALGRVVARYPYLGRLSVQVAPVMLDPQRGKVFALRLVARNGSDAKALCRNLRGIGYGCSVQ